MNKKERIFDAAHEVLGEQGFHGLSIAVVAKKARVAAGTIYRYFSDKDDLIRQLYRHTILQCHPLVMEGVQTEEVSFEQFRRLWLNIHAIFVDEPNALKCKLQYETSPLGAELEQDPVIKAAWAPLDRFFERGLEQGLFIDLPVRVLQVLSLDCVANMALQSQVAPIRTDARPAGSRDPGLLASYFDPLNIALISQEREFMKKWMSIMLLIALALFGSVIGFNLFKQKMIANYMANMPEPEFPVTTHKVETRDWVPTIEAIGFIEPNQGVTLSTEQSGTIDSISFESGDTVKPDQLLLSLDASVEKANLRASMAKLPAAKAKFDRYQNLFTKGSISRDQLDDTEATYRSLEADIESLKSTIARREVRAPFAGVVGLRNVFLGQYLQPGTDIVRLEDTSVMRLRFTVPQTDISRIRLNQDILINVDSYPHRQFKGHISAIEPAVNYQSGLIQVQADIPNNDGQLRSGMFARASILLPAQKDQIVLPQTAITFTLYGENVYLVKEKDGVKRVEQVVVKVSERKGNDAHVVSGIKAGDEVVMSGQVRLSNGAKVKIVQDQGLKVPDQVPML